MSSISPRITALPIILRKLTVVRTRQVNPRLRRVTVGGPELGEFIRGGHAMPSFDSRGFDDHVKLLFAPGADVSLEVPVQLAQGIQWRASDALVTRDYTPIYFDRDAGEVSFDFVVHSPQAQIEAGPAESWACAAVPGDDLWLVGPKSSTVVPEDVDWVLLLGDETAQPAVERFLFDRPCSGPVHIILAVADESARRDDLSLAEGDSLTWVIAEPGDRAALVDALAAAELPTGAPYVWAAAESRALLPVRKFVARELKVDKRHTNITGYWHQRGETGPVGTDSAPTVRLPLVTSPVSWFAVRVALELGLLDVIDVHRPTCVELSALLGRPGTRLDPLIEVLLDCGVLVRTANRLALTETGETLIAGEREQAAFIGPDADKALALADLAGALRDGGSAWKLRTGQTYAEYAQRDQLVHDDLVSESDSRVFLLPAITALDVFADQGQILLAGPGAQVVATGLRDGAGFAGQIAVSNELGRLSAVAARFDAAVVIDALAHRNAHESATYLQDLHQVADALVVIESTEADAYAPGNTERALVHLAAVGEPPRSAESLAAILSAAGWAVTQSVALGWGTRAFVASRTHVRE